MSALTTSLRDLVNPACGWSFVGLRVGLIGLTLLGAGLHTAWPQGHSIPAGTFSAKKVTRTKITPLHIALQAGFRNDTVRIEVDGKEIFSRTGVTTPTHVGRADSFDVSLPEGTRRVFVAIPTRQTSETIPLTLTAPTWLGILLSREGKITHQVSSQPFAYM